MARVKFTPYIEQAVLDRARAAVAACSGQVPSAKTLNVLIQTALDREVTLLEQHRNGGQPFPPIQTMPGAGGRR